VPSTLLKRKETVMQMEEKLKEKPQWKGKINALAVRMPVVRLRLIQMLTRIGIVLKATRLKRRDAKETMPGGSRGTGQEPEPDCTSA
jgi:hypothetical protein